MSTNRLNIIFAGSGEFGSPTLRRLVQCGHHIVQIYTQPDRPAGRGKKLTPTPIAQLAQELRIPVIRTSDINTERLPDADLMIVIAFGQKIGEAAVHHPRLGSVNLHASLLPKYRGAAPIHWAILNGEKTTGNSIIRLANKMDAGAILAQSEFEITPSETTGELHDRLAIDGADLIEHVLKQLTAGASTEREQNPAAASLAPKVSREMARLDWTQSAQLLARRINGLSPWPGCRVRLVDENGKEVSRMTLLRAATNEPTGPPGAHPGFAASIPAGSITDRGTVATVHRGEIQILELQPEGKRPMALKDYRRGNPWPAGFWLESI